MPKGKKVVQRYGDLELPDAPVKGKKKRSHTPSIKKKILVELRARRKQISAQKKALNKELSAVKRDIRSLSCRKKKTTTKKDTSVPFVEGGGVKLF